MAFGSLELFVQLGQETVHPTHQYLYFWCGMCVRLNVVEWVLLMDECRGFIILDVYATVHITTCTLQGSVPRLFDVRWEMMRVNFG